MKKHLLGCLGILALLLAACAPAATPAPAKEKEEPIKLGILAPLTGPFGALGTAELNAAKLYVEQAGNKIAGRPVRLIVEDDELKPDVALTKAKKLVELDRVHAVLGIISSASCLAIRDYMEAQKTVWFGTCSVDALTQEKRSPYFFRPSYGTNQSTAPIFAYAVQNLGYRKFHSVALDYAGPRLSFEWGKKALKDLGGEIVADLWPPLGTADFGPYLARVDPAKADAVWAIVLGADAVRFIRQYKEFGLKDKLPMVVPGVAVSEALLPQMGDAALGIVSGAPWAGGIDTPENKAFMKAYQDKFREVPQDWSFFIWTAMLAIDQAAKAVDGKVEDVAAFIKALERVEVMTPAGPFRFDEFHGPIHTWYIAEVRKVDGEYRNVPIYTEPGVGQFWVPKK